VLVRYCTLAVPLTVQVLLAMLVLLAVLGPLAGPARVVLLQMATPVAVSLVV